MSKMAVQRSLGQKESGIYPQETQPKLKGQNRVQESHLELIKNITSTNIGKPTIVEAQRILSIFEGLQQNLKIFQSFDQEFVSKFTDVLKSKLSKELVKQLSQDALNILKEQADHEAKYKPFATLDQQMQDEEEIDEEKLIEKEKVYKQLEKNFQNLIRFFKENPEDLEIITQLKPNLNSDIKEISNYIECWKIIYWKKLSTASEEQTSQEIQTQNLEDRITKLIDRKDSCNKDKQHIENEWREFQEKKKEEMEKLRSEIQEVKQNEIEMSKQYEEQIKKELQQKQQEHQAKEAEYKKQIEDKNKELELEIKKNREVEGKLKQNKKKAEGNLQENISQYDQEMEQKVTQKQTLEDELDKIKKELYHLKKHFKKIEEERVREESVEEMFRKKRELHEIHEKRKNAAAQHIQIAYQRFKDGKGKKKKKKGGKKK